jgi:hypothetical protein
MITVVDLYASDLMHLEINLFFLRLYRDQLCEEIHLFAERRHLEAIAKTVAIGNLHPFSSVRAVAQWHAPRVLIRELLTIFRVFRAVWHARRNGSRFLHVLCASHFAHIILRIVLRVLPAGCPVILNLHSELESLTRKENKWWRPGYWFPYSLRIPVNRLYIVVLGSNIKAEAERRGIHTTGWIAIEHPYTFPERDDARVKESKTLVVGAIGAASTTRGTDEFFSLADRFEHEISLGQVRFTIIGKIHPSLRKHFTRHVDIPDFVGFYDKEQYDQAIDDLDVILFLSPRDSYQLTASGSIFDAIAHNKPIIAYETAYFKWLRRLVTGDAISLVRDLDDAERTLREWVEHGVPGSLHNAYRSIKVTHSIATVANMYLKQLEDNLEARSGG